MNEAEWLTSDRPGLLQAYRASFFRDGRLTGADNVTARKVRLLACACVRQVWDFLADDRCRVALDAAERFADGLAPEEEAYTAAQAARAAREEAGRGPRTPDEQKIISLLAQDVGWTASTVTDLLTLSGGHQVLAAGWEKTHNALVRDLFGNPFRPVAADPAWLTPTVIRLAESIYRDRRFADLPVLADALQTAGCTDEQVLSHCRGLGPHARGCWVVDAILGRC